MSEDKAGPTGEFPRGKMNDADQGELKIAIGIDWSTKLIVMNFGAPVTWLALDRHQAAEIAGNLIDRATMLQEEEQGE